ncbi:hypothetical protein F5B17DRAFT_1091 [Nemania serpens]|nr:hypothetical protein F5B17DRAFT_1091 [Nemania serpens]
MQTADSPWHEAQVLQRLRGLDELHDDYPYRLVRELDRVSDGPSLLNQENLVFGVIHINNSTYEGLTVDYIGTYTTAKAANNRVLDFWGQKYGTEMFTNNPRYNDFNRLEWAKDSRSHSSQISPVKKRNDDSSGGVEANGSRWAIAHQCLTLSHRSREEEKKVYAVVSSMRDQGIHF